MILLERRTLSSLPVAGPTWLRRSHVTAGVSILAAIGLAGMASRPKLEVGRVWISRKNQRERMENQDPSTSTQHQQVSSTLLYAHGIIYDMTKAMELYHILFRVCIVSWICAQSPHSSGPRPTSIQPAGRQRT